MNAITLFYLLIILIFLAIGAGIVFHMLHYKINRRVAGIMFVIYMSGSFLLLLSNIAFFRSVNWYQIFSSF
jgi:hypothetical protein